MTIHHIAITVAELDVEATDTFMAWLGMVPLPITEAEPQYVYERKQTQAWYTDGTHGYLDVHIVENPDEVTVWGWGHICIRANSWQHWDSLRMQDQYKTRDNDTGRFWLEGPGGIRVEVRQPK